jgi:hypothetical protein
MSGSPRLEDFMITDGLPMPWNNLQHALAVGMDYSDGAKKVAKFLHNFEEAIPLDELFEILLKADPPREWFEFLIVCMIDTGFSDVEVARNVLRLRCLRRLYMKMSGGAPLEQQEKDIFEEVKSITKIDNVTAFLGLTYFTHKLVESLIEKESIHSFHRQLLIKLIQLEAQALKVRINRLSDSVDAYSMKEMGRMLPVIKRFDENLNEAQHLASSIEKEITLGQASMTFAHALKVGSFEKWVGKMGNGKEVMLLKEVLLLQSQKLAPTRSVVALMSVYRWVHEAHDLKASPVLWAKRALEMYDNGRFTIELSTVIEQLRDHLLEAGAWIEGNVVSGNFSDRLYTQWIGTNGLSRPLNRKQESEERERQLTGRELIHRFYNNESIILRLLDNPEISTIPGAIEYLAKRSRSVPVLSKIASNSNLYAGSNNRGVPEALLINPSKIPLSLLRIFLKPSFFNSSELQRLILTNSQMRPEVMSEIKNMK